MDVLGAVRGMNDWVERRHVLAFLLVTLVVAALALLVLNQRPLQVALSAVAAGIGVVFGMWLSE